MLEGSEIVISEGRKEYECDRVPSGEQNYYGYYGIKGYCRNKKNNCGRRWPSSKGKLVDQRQSPSQPPEALKQVRSLKENLGSCQGRLWRKAGDIYRKLLPPWTVVSLGCCGSVGLAGGRKSCIQRRECEGNLDLLLSLHLSLTTPNHGNLQKVMAAALSPSSKSYAVSLLTHFNHKP